MRRSTGLVMFWIGAVMIFTGAWLVMWWIAPFWRSAAPQEIAGTIWAFGGLVFMLISLSVPVGILLLVIGMLLYADKDAPRAGPFVLIVFIAVLAAVSMLVLPTMPYLPVLFGILGGLILLFFFAAVWCWAKRRVALKSAARLAADYQLLSWVFFLLTATTTCAMLGNPFGGLFFTEQVLADNAMPWYYSMGIKAALYLAAGMLFAFLSQYVGHKADAESRPTQEL